MRQNKKGIEILKDDTKQHTLYMYVTRERERERESTDEDLALNNYFISQTTCVCSQPTTKTQQLTL